MWLRMLSCVVSQGYVIAVNDKMRVSLLPIFDGAATTLDIWDMESNKLEAESSKSQPAHDA